MLRPISLDPLRLACCPKSTPGPRWGSLTFFSKRWRHGMVTGGRCKRAHLDPTDRPRTLSHRGDSLVELALQPLVFFLETQDHVDTRQIEPIV
jgi:hypothetical protein